MLLVVCQLSRDVKVCLLAKILQSIANSTSKCSAQNLGSKVTKRRRGSFPRGHDQRSRFQIFSNMYCLDASMSLVVYENTLPSFVVN